MLCILLELHFFFPISSFLLRSRIQLSVWYPEKSSLYYFNFFLFSFLFKNIRCFFLSTVFLPFALLSFYRIYNAIIILFDVIDKTELDFLLQHKKNVQKINYVRPLYMHFECVHCPMVKLYVCGIHSAQYTPERNHVHVFLIF